MFKSISLGNLAGIDIRVHPSLLLAVVWVSYEFGYAAGEGVPGVIFGLTLLTVIFGCVVMHELGHSFMAREFGSGTKEITLYPLGGAAYIERMPANPKREAAVTIAGPLVNVAIAACLLPIVIVIGLIAGFDSSEDFLIAAAEPTVIGLIVSIFLFNIANVLFNLIPAFPMDGGRVLRSFLARRNGFVRGTQVAARVGKVIAVGFALVGLFGIPGVYPVNPILVLIAIFVWFGATAEAAAVEYRSVGTGLTVGQVMVRRFDTLPAWAPLERAAELLTSTDQRDFPVQEVNGGFAGLLTRDLLVLGLHRFGAAAEVRQVMATNVPLLAEAAPFPAALEALLHSRLPALPVVDARGAVIGLFSKDNVADLMLVRRSTGR